MSASVRLLACATLALTCIASIANAGATAAPADADPLSFWKDARPGHCDESLRAKVISAKPHGHDVLVRVKLDRSHKQYTATVGHATVQDFKPGSSFCAQDWVDD